MLSRWSTGGQNIDASEVRHQHSDFGAQACGAPSRQNSCCPDRTKTAVLAAGWQTVRIERGEALAEAGPALRSFDALSF